MADSGDTDLRVEALGVAHGVLEVEELAAIVLSSAVRFDMIAEVSQPMTDEAVLLMYAPYLPVRERLDS